MKANCVHMKRDAWMLICMFAVFKKSKIDFQSNGLILIFNVKILLKKVPTEFFIL